MLSPETTQIVVALLAALSIGGVLVAAFYSRVSHRSESQKRFANIAAQDSSTSRRAATSETGRKQAIESTLRELEEKQKFRAGAKPSLVNRMRQAGLSWSKQTYYTVCLMAGAGSFVGVLGLFNVSALPAVGFGIAGGLLLPHLYVNARRNKRFKGFAAEFPNAVDVIVRGVKAGLPLVDCLRIISTEAQEPVRSEFRTIVEDQTLGMPIDQAVQRLSERVPLAEANFFAIVVGLQSRTGGSLSETLGNLSKVLRERKKMQAKIKAMSSEAKASAGIIGSLPVVVTMLVYLTSPDYITLLFTTGTGQITLAASLAWMGVGIFIMRQMINFDF
nr:type II secretion system F family protein [Microvirga aerophila]